jgi:hypothetical protein
MPGKIKMGKIKPNPRPGGDPRKQRPDYGIMPVPKPKPGKPGTPAGTRTTRERGR